MWGPHVRASSTSSPRPLLSPRRRRSPRPRRRLPVPAPVRLLHQGAAAFTPPHSAASALPLPVTDAAPSRPPPPLMAGRRAPTPPPPRPFPFPLRPIKGQHHPLRLPHLSPLLLPHRSAVPAGARSAAAGAASISFAGAFPSLPSSQVHSPCPPLHFCVFPVVIGGRKGLFGRRRRSSGEPAAGRPSAAAQPLACDQGHPI
jgi:hypothetical protein